MVHSLWGFVAACYRAVFSVLSYFMSFCPVWWILSGIVITLLGKSRELITLLFVVLTHCRLNRISHTIYWKSPISIFGTSSYEIYIFLEKNG